MDDPSIALLGSSQYKGDCIWAEKDMGTPHGSVTVRTRLQANALQTGLSLSNQRSNDAQDKGNTSQKRMQPL